jgi:hypothetical protein
MAIYPLYRDFFRFLQTLDSDGDPWELYQKIYLGPHKRFLKAYWKSFFPQMDLGTLQDRVRRVSQGHYAALEHLIELNVPEVKTQDTLSRCLAHLPRFPEPDVYLMIGFFSSDGFVVEVEGWPAIGIGLERYKDFRLLDVILAHEYCHYARRLALGGSLRWGGETLAEKLLSEGLSVCFSQKIFPDRTLCDHLLMSPRRLNWCQANGQMLESIAQKEFTSTRLVPILFGRGDPGAGVPPRVGIYLGYRLVERMLKEEGEPSFEDLLSKSHLPMTS